MITTGCEGCCFLGEENDQKGCMLGKFCCIKDGHVVAPGYCRTCRSTEWASKQKTKELQQLHEKVIEENSLEFDLLIFFDEQYNTVQDLQRTLDSDWYKKYVKKIIIMDMTGFGDRKNIALQFLKNNKNTIPITIDSSAVHEKVLDRESTIRRVSSQVTSSMFMVIPAGHIMNKMMSLETALRDIPSRVIHWSFPFVCGSSAMVPNKLYYGLFITKPYNALTKADTKKSFTNNLRTEEQETQMGLSWFCSELYLT